MAGRATTQLIIDADASKASAAIQKFGGQWDAALQKLQKPLDDIAALQALEGKLLGTEQAMAATKARLDEMKAAMLAAEAPSKQLIADYQYAQSELKKLDRAHTTQLGQLSAMRGALKATGIDTSQLAAEHGRLAAELEKTTAAAKREADTAAARKALGAADIKAEQQRLVELRHQYQLLADDATLTGAERARAESVYQQQVSQTLAKLRELRGVEQDTSGPDAAAAAAAALAAARRSLGADDIKAAQLRLVELRRQYQLLGNDASLSGAERARVERQYRAQVSETLTDLRRLRGQAEETGEALDTSVTRWSDKAMTAMQTLAVGYGVNMFATWIADANAATVEASRLAEAAGMTVEQFTALRYASKTVGVEQEQLGSILRDVQDKFGDLLGNESGELQDFFANIAPLVGVTAEQFRGLNAADALQLYVSTLERAGVGQQQMVNAMESIADEGSRLLPLLRNNGEELKRLTTEAEQFGLVVSTEAAAEAKAFEHQLDTLQAIGGNVATRINAEMLPTFSALTGALIETEKGSGLASTAAGALSIVLKGLAVIALATGTVFGNMGRWIGGAAAAAHAVARGEFSEAADILKTVWEDNTRAMEESVRTATKIVTGELEAQGKAAAAAAAEQKQVQQDLQQASAAHAEAIAGDYKRLSDAAKARLQELTAAERAASRELESVRAERAEMEKRYQGVLDDLSGSAAPQASFTQANNLRDQAAAAMDAGDIERARDLARQSLEMVQEMAAAGQNTAGLEWIVESLRGIERAASDLEETSAKAALDGIKASMQEIEKAAEPLKDLKIEAAMTPEAQAKAIADMQKLAGILGETLTVSITPVVGDVAGTGVTATSDLPGYAVGTSSAPPGMAWVGEAGPELVQFAGGERVYTAAQSAAIMAGMSLPDRTAGAAGAVAAAGQSAGGDTLNLHLPGGEVVTVRGAVSDDTDLRRLARKFGRPY